MRIGINGYFLDKPSTGIGIVLRAYLREFVKYSQHEFFVFTADRATQNLGKNIKKVISQNLPANSPNIIKKTWFERNLNRFAKKYKCDAIWSPYPIPNHLSVPSIITVHDIIPFADKRYQRMRTKIYNRGLKKNFSKISKLHFVSESAMQDFSSFFTKIKTPKFVAKNSYFVPEEVELKEELTYKSPYLFYIGGYDPRKNLPLLLKSWASIADETHIDLVLGGKPPKESRLAVSPQNLIQEYVPKSMQHRVHITGYLTEEEKFMLYKNALAEVNLSEAEGFDLPLLEAIAVGCPAIVSDIPVHREVGGEAALYCNTKTAEETLRKVIFQKETREELKVKAKIQKDKFSWEKSAKKLLTEIENLI